MSNTVRYSLYALGFLVLGFLIWYFSNIVIYILAALVFALIGRPLFDLLDRVRIRKFHLPAGIRAFITLVIVIVVLLSFFGMFIPLLAVKIRELSSIDTQQLVIQFQGPLEKVTQFINSYILQPEKAFSAEKAIQQWISRINLNQVAGVFGSVAGWLGNISLAFFSISFITFFFLKDERMFSNALMLLIPDKHTGAVSKALKAARELLSRYFIGIMAEVTAVILLSTIGLLLIGFSLKDSLLVGFLAGIFNIIPYLGPVMGTLFGLFTGLVSYLGHPDGRNIIVTGILIVVVFMIVQLIDNMLVQPYVYSSSVHAHPLEIFIVFLIAGSIGGLAGMILAIPAYTVLRVFAKEFLNNFKLVQSLTKNI